jgi:hypothetical protein
MAVDDTSSNTSAAYENAIWDGELPAPTGKLAKEFDKLDIAEQKELATAVFTFLSTNTSNLTQLNAENRLYTVLVNLPASSDIRVLYGLGYGTSGIGITSPIEDKILTMSGEGDASVGAPPSLALPNTVRDMITLRTPTDTELQTALQNPTATWNRFRSSNINETTTTTIMQLAPIPTFLVYDGFNKDLSAEEVYERVLSLDDQENQMVQHCKNFLRSCTVARNIPDPKPHCPNSDFITAPTIEARNWAKAKFALIAPALTEQRATTDNTTPTNPELTALLQRLAPAATDAVENQDDNTKPEDKLGMSPTELRSTLAMCGLREGEESLLPEWFEKINEKGQNDNTRNQIIIATLKNILFEDAEIPVTAPLLLMIRKRKWLSDDPTATHRTAAKGLSIFAVAPMTEDEVALINDTMEALEQATTTTAKEYKDVTRIKAKVPEDAHDFMLLLKTFANLLYALFGSNCPLYLQVRRMIKAFTAYTRTALKALTMSTKASIMWITLLQTRHFAGGNYTTLAEFRNMMDKITAKENNITHAEVPAAFFKKDTNKRKFDDVADTPKNPNTPPPRRPLLFTPPVTPSPPRPPRVHPLLKAKIVDNVLRKNPTISLSRIAKFCNTSLNNLSKDTSKCVLGFLGTCNSRYCRRRHMTATDAEADHMVLQLEKAITDPDAIKSFEG